MKSFFLIPVFFLLGAFPSSAQMYQHLENEIGKIIFYDTEINFKKTPAYIIGVKIQDSTYIYSYGSASTTEIIPPQQTDLFEIGGLTKSFTALLAGRMVNEQLLSPDSSINVYLPKAYRNPYAKNLSILDLVQHTSGLPRLPEGIGLKEKDPDNPFGNYTKTDLLEFYKNYIPSTQEKKSYNYSHFNYALLEIILESAGGETYDFLLKKYILKPAGMTSTGVELQGLSNTNMITAYSLGGKQVAPWKMQSFAASEGLKSNMDDLLKYLELNLHKQIPSLKPILVRNQTAIVDTKLTKRTFGGNGWHVLKMKNYYDVILHAGSTTGYRSFMGFVNETETGVIILANSPRSMNGLGLLILRMINNNWKTRNKTRKTKNNVHQ